MIKNEDIWDGESDLHGGQNEGGETKMVKTCEEEIHRCPSQEVCEQLAMVGLRRGRGRMKKYRGEVIRQDMTHFQLTQEMTLDRKI